MSKDEFVLEIIAYYGDFANDSVYRQFLRVLAKIEDTNLQKIFDWIISNVPANFRVDVKTLMDATRACFVGFVEPKKKCPVCGANIAEEAQHCIHCDYDYSQTPEQYKATLVNPEQVQELMEQMFAKFALKQQMLKKELKNEQ